MAAARDDLPTLDVTSRGTRFVDNDGRTLTLRGVNLGGAKLPAGFRSDQSEEAGDDASYVGRPFPLAEAAEHLGRLRAWGFNIVRLSVTWDGLEHKGPMKASPGTTAGIWRTCRSTRGRRRRAT